VVALSTPMGVNSFPSGVLFLEFVAFSAKSSPTARPGVLPLPCLGSLPVPPAATIQVPPPKGPLFLVPQWPHTAPRFSCFRVSIPFPSKPDHRRRPFFREFFDVWYTLTCSLPLTRRTPPSGGLGITLSSRCCEDGCGGQVEKELFTRAFCRGPLPVCVALLPQEVHSLFKNASEIAVFFGKTVAPSLCFSSNPLCRTAILSRTPSLFPM